MWVTHLLPGQYKISAPKPVRVVAPANGGIFEYKTDQRPRKTDLLKFEQPTRVPPRAPCFSDRTGDVLQTTELQHSQSDRLLEYFSARGAGSIEAIRNYCALTAPPGTSWHGVLSNVDDLGHVDVCWEKRTWAIAQRTSCPRAINGFESFLTGARARETIERLAANGIRAHLDVRCRDSRRGPMPSCIVMPTKAVTKAAATLEQLGINVLSEPPALTIAPHIAPVTETQWWIGTQFAPSSRVRATLKRWLPDQLRWGSVSDEAELTPPALYRWRENGFPMHYIVLENIRAEVLDPATAKWFLASSEKSWLVYDRRNAKLLIPAALGLPRIWRRICSLSSGLTPTRQYRILHYEDIPLVLARMLAVRLNQSRAEGLQ